ncbi:MAG: HIT family hydrolase, partial [Nitrospinae bacterium]|nr:HIT family hydrolase [Nitrospinota bacterium]
MKTLWAPWRMSYLDTPQKDSCIFCDKPKEAADKENFWFFRNKVEVKKLSLIKFRNYNEIKG